MLQEITNLRKEKESLGESEALYRFMFVENPQAMWILDLRSLRFLTVNNAALRLYGFAAQEWGTLTASELLAPESAAAFRQDLAKPCSGPQFRGRWRHRRRDRKLIDVDITAVDLKYAGSPARLILATDASQQHQLGRWVSAHFFRRHRSSNTTEASFTLPTVAVKRWRAQRVWHGKILKTIDCFQFEGWRVFEAGGAPCSPEISHD